MFSPIYIFAGGGTGGHLYPGLAVATELLERRGDARVVFACSPRPIDRRILDPLDHAVVAQPVQPLPRRPGQAGRFLLSWVRSNLLARDMIRDLQPAAVLGLGGFAAGPLVRQAARRRAVTALLNPDAVPGKANRYLARRADAIFTQFADTVGCFPARLRGRVIHAGCPIRQGLACGDRHEAMEFFGLDQDRRTVLVLGGSLGAESINRAMARIAGRLAHAGRWQVLHITGGRERDALAGAYDSAGVTASVPEYCHRMDLAYAAGDLAICRAGASTMAELAASATPAVLMPYPHHRDQHQRRNAGEYVRAGAGLLCDDVVDPAVNADRLAGILDELLDDDGKLAGMRQAAGQLGRPHAAAAVAEWLLSRCG